MGWCKKLSSAQLYDQYESWGTRFFYHSQKEKSVVGIVEVIREARQDSTTTDKRWQCVQIKALKSMNTIVHLHQIKTQPKLNGMMLVNNPRLSVQPVKEHEWKIVCSLGGVTPKS